MRPPTLVAGEYAAHPLHASDLNWVEKNCYIDLWIELLHALGLDPHACLPFVVATDFEVDQWTFYKPSLDELRDLYGVEVHELNVVKPLLDHAREQLGAGRWLCVEADAHWLPDTHGTDYRRSHTKTTIGIVGLDAHRRELTYLHNAGCFRLVGDDFDSLFATGVTGGGLPFMAEAVRLDRIRRRAPAALRELSRALLRKHVTRRPDTNPVGRLAGELQAQLPRLHSEGIDAYHRWAFGTVRQLGSAAELAAHYARWLDLQAPALVEAAREFDTASSMCKALILKLARAVCARRPIDSALAFAPIASAWWRGIDALATQAA